MKCVNYLVFVLFTICVIAISVAKYYIERTKHYSAQMDKLLTKCENDLPANLVRRLDECGQQLDEFSAKFQSQETKIQELQKIIDGGKLCP